MSYVANLSARRPIVIGVVTLSLLLSGFGFWSIAFEISAAVVASGRVEVEKNRQIVQHPDGGVVTAIFVTEGDRVTAGDILIRLDGAALESEQAIVAGQLFEQRARRTRLEAERDGRGKLIFPQPLLRDAATSVEMAEQIEGQRRLFADRVETITRTIEQLELRKSQTAAQIDGMMAQRKALEDQQSLVAQEKNDQQSLLDKGLAQSTRVLSLRREEARLIGQLGELAAAKAQAEGRITEIDLEILRLGAMRREEASTQLRDLGASENQLSLRLGALDEQIERLHVRAPASGVVLGLKVTTPRAVLRPAETLAYIVPTDRPLIITASIEPVDIDEVHVGQSAKLVFPTFSARRTPEIEGNVTLVSADSLTDETTGIHFYRIEIAVSLPEAERLMRPLMPGMPVDVYLQTGMRSPLSYLIKPFSDYFRKALRES